MRNSNAASVDRWDMSFDSDASRLGAVLEDYLQRLESGERVDAEAFIAAHPDVADELRESIGKLEALRRLADRIEAMPIPAVPGSAGSAIPPTRLGDYVIGREIGRGGMGVVYEAEQQSLGRRVALKVLPLSSLLERRRIARFKNEAAAAASLDHPHIVAVYGVGCDAGTHYYAMQLVQGRSLAELIADRAGRVSGKPPAAAETAGITADLTLASSRGAGFYRAVAEVGRQAATALHFAHQRGVVHRDVKPSNLLIDDQGHVLVTDFGLASTQADVGLTRTGELLGTLRYMSPEQATGDGPVDHRTDVYGLGATLYELITGRPLVTAENQAEVLRELIDRSPQPLRKIDVAVPYDLATIVDKATAHNRDDRYATAGDLADDLERFLDHKPIVARRPSKWRKAMSWARRNRLAAVLIGMIGAGVVAAAIGGVSYAVRLAKKHDDLERSLYARDVALAQRLIDEGALVRAEATLLKWTASPEARARRGFEWYFLWRRLRENSADAVLEHSADCFESIVVPGPPRIVTGSFRSTIAFWDAKTFERLADESISTPHATQVNTLQYDEPTGVLASGGDTGKVCLWRLSDRTLLDEFQVDAPSQANKVICFAFSGDGRWLAASTFDHTERCLRPQHDRFHLRSTASSAGPDAPRLWPAAQDSLQPRWRAPRDILDGGDWCLARVPSRGDRRRRGGVRTRVNAQAVGAADLEFAAAFGWASARDRLWQLGRQRSAPSHRGVGHVRVASAEIGPARRAGPAE